ncbi:MAG: hypothetical protein HXS47_12845 [Theionarchaea archaeon]|nr:hypothetical protein [Theionarchaea archaeon]
MQAPLFSFTRRTHLIPVYVIILITAGCIDQHTSPPACTSCEEPAQVPFSGKAITVLTDEGVFLLVPVAQYSALVQVVGKKQCYDEDSELVPVDLCVVWGSLADPSLLQYTEFIQEERSCTCMYDERSPADDPAVLTQFVNIHIIPATTHILDALYAVNPGDIIILEGYLVNIYVEGVLYIETSTVWTDSGAGSCEILYLTALSVVQ